MAGRVVITGASRGIGEALAKRFAARGNDLLLSARSASELEALATQLKAAHEVSVETLAVDLGTEPGCQMLIRRANELGPTVGLVNNAGVGTAGLFKDVDAEQERKMVRLNVEAVVALCHGFVPLLHGQSGAFIMNIASTAALQPVPLFATYAATKAFVLSLSEALAEELAADGIHVLALCPGVTETGFQKTADVVTVAPGGGKAATPDEVAAFAISSLESHKRVAVHGLQNALMAFGTRFAPRSLITKVSRKVMEPWIAHRPRT